MPDRDEMGKVAAADIYAKINELLSKKEEINMIFAAAPSQNDVLKALVEDKEIIVIPTKTVPQGIAALINYAYDKEPEANAEQMTTEMKRVKTGQVTYAVRDTNIDGKEIHEGNIMGIGDHGIISVGTDINETTKEMLAELVDEDSELISLYYGADVSEEDAENFAAEIEELYPDVDIDAHFGGQPIYYYVLAVE